MYSNEELNAIHSSKVGFEFEFFANESLDSAKESLSRTLNKKIRIEEKAHSDFAPTEDVFKMEPDNSGGTGMIELVTGPLPFVEAKLIMAKTLKWIRENGSTNERCSIHVNLAFDGKKLGPITNMTKLDIGKFVLNFDEDRVYEAFPNRKDSVYNREHLIRLPIARGEEQGGVVRLGARGGEEDPRVRDPRDLGHHLGELDHGLGQVQGRGVEHLAGLLADRGRHLRVVVADHRGQHPTEEVEVAVARRVPYLRAAAAVDLDRFRVERGDE